MATPGRIEIKGQAELERAFLQVRREVLTELRPALAEIGDVVRKDAEGKANSLISHIGPRWGRMRLGITTSAVYVAPRTRPSGGSPRPNLGTLLMDKAMSPALEEHQEEAVARLTTVVDVSAATAGFF